MTGMARDHDHRIASHRRSLHRCEGAIDTRLITFTTVVLVVAAACSSEPRGPALPAPRDRTQQAHEGAKPMQGRLTQLKALIGTDQQAFVERFGIRP